jgi:hypothetical protein
MKTIPGFMLSLILLLFSMESQGQSIIDTIAIQDFEIVPSQPTLAFSGPVIYNSGYSGSNAAPPNSPIGIGGSRAWETTTNSSGLTLVFNNVLIPNYYDSVFAQFRLAAMNLNSSTGGPDDLDWVQFSYSLDGGATYTNRIRIKGAVNNNSFWPYSATGTARLYYQPANEASFQPTNSGLQTTEGYSTVEVVFPGNVSQLQLKITARSSSSSDTWLIDNVLIRGKKTCTNTMAIVNHQSCGTYIWPVNGQTYTLSGSYTDTIPNTNGCDSIITLNLVVKQNSSATISKKVCFSYYWPLSGITYHSAGSYTHTIANAADCDSVITLNLSTTAVDTTISQTGITLTSNQTGASYQWLNCNAGMQVIPGAVFQSFTPGVNGSFAVRVTVDSCARISSCKTIVGVGIEEASSRTSLSASLNPGRGNFLIHYYGTVSGQAYRVCSMSGQVVDEGIVESPVFSLNLGRHPTGIYVLICGESRLRLFVGD